jgi:hypothetical protein
MGNKYGLFMIESLVVGSILGCTARFVDWSGIALPSIPWGDVCIATVDIVLGLAGLGLLGLIAFTVGTGWILLLKGMLRRLRAQ